jgi:2-polyprenyl-3-methyl-5-hydroxy-6-metoxy-1,4-benzoquinol methylase
LNKNRDYDVIEYGCGNGIFITQIASKTRGNGHNYIGVDLNKEIITINKQKYKHTEVNFKTGSADEIPRKEKSIIMFFGTLMYIENSSIRNIFNGIYENKQILAFSENSYDLQSRKSLKRDVFAYSHGYKYLLDDSNLSLTHEQIFQEENKTIFNIQCMCRVI